MEMPNVKLEASPLRRAAFDLEDELNNAQDVVDAAEKHWDRKYADYQRAVTSDCSMERLQRLYELALDAEHRWNAACKVRDRVAHDCETMCDMVDLSESLILPRGTTERAR